MGTLETITIRRDPTMGTSQGTFGAGWEGKQPNLQDPYELLPLDDPVLRGKSKMPMKAKV